MRQVAPFGVLRLQEVRCLVEAPIEDAGDVVAVPEGLLEQAKEGHFAFQRA